MFHFDTPQALETEFGGWVDKRMVDAFVAYSTFLFAEFGNQVENWVTLNEPNMHCSMVYAGQFPPLYPNSTTVGEDNVYLCIHHTILAHARTHTIFRKYFRKSQPRTLVGVGAIALGSRSIDSDPDNVEAADRVNQFDVGLILHPLTNGDYSDYVKERLSALGRKLPVFSQEEKLSLIGEKSFCF